MTAIITGAAQGIGFACVRAFVREGGKVVLADIDEGRGGEALEAIRGGDDGAAAAFLPADVSREDDVRRLVAFAIDTFGGIDVCLNNAGITHRADVLDIAAEDFDRVIAVNLRGPFLLGQAVARHMVETGRRGSIINIGSVNAVVSLLDNPAYVASKGGLVQLTRALAVGLAARGIRVNAIGPGSINTELQRRGMSRDPESRRMVLSRTPLGRLGEPEEVAEVAVFLASEKSSYITGQCIYVEGGRLGLNFTVPVQDDWAVQ